MDNQKLSLAQEKNLNLMLLKFSKNTIDKVDIFSLESMGRYKRETAIVKVFKSSRFQDFKTENYSSETEAFLDIVLKGDGVKMKVIADVFDFSTCFLSESLYSKVNRGIISEREVIQLLTSLIHRLSKFFGVNTSKSLEELVWILYDNHKYFTLEDFIKFFQMSKQSEFKTPFEHISARGVNAEFLQEWMKIYVDRRDDAMNKWRSDFAKNNNNVITDSNAIYPTFKKVVENENSKETLEQKEKLKKLRIEHEKLINNQSAWSKLVDHIFSEELVFEKDWFQKSDEDLRSEAKRRGAEQFGKWKKEFQETKSTESEKINEKDEIELTADGFLTAINDVGQDVRTRVSALTLEKYYEARIGIYIKKSMSEINYTAPDKMIREGIYKLKVELKLTTGEHLISHVFTEEISKKKNRGTFIQVENHLIRQFFDEKNRAYKNYFQNEIKNNKLPYPKKEYLLREARLWVVNKCIPV